MGKKITSDTENIILQLFNGEKKTVSEISKELHISRPTIYNVLKNYRVPITVEKKEKKETANILQLLSLRLWYFCEDYELLCKMFTVEVCLHGCNKVVVPKKMTSIINAEKIKKVVKLVNRAGLECELHFAVA